MTKLDPYYDHNNFPEPVTDPAQPTLQQLVVARETEYEDVGVAYLMERISQANLPPDATVVYRDDEFVIARLPHPRALVSTEAGGPCTAAGQEYATFHTACTKPGTVRVTQLALPGWSATVNGHAVPVRTDPSGFYQLVDVPAGRATVVMHYWPPGLTEGLALGALGVVLAVLLTVLDRRRERRRRARLGAPARSP
jgi:hypothetical protein